MDGTLTFDIDYMVFVAPNPQQADKFFALVYPLDTTVWLFILISFVLATIAFVTLSKTEEMVTQNLDFNRRNIIILFNNKIIKKKLETWSSVSRCTWFTFATLIGLVRTLTC